MFAVQYLSGTKYQHHSLSCGTEDLSEPVFKNRNQLKFSNKLVTDKDQQNSKEVGFRAGFGSFVAT